MKRYRLWLAVMIPVCLGCMVGLHDAPVFGAIIDPDPLPTVFKQRERLMQAMDANPQAVVEVLEANLTQAKADTIIQVLFPEPSDIEVKEKLQRIRHNLLIEGFDNTDVTVVQLTERIDAIPDLVVEEIVPK